MAKTFHCYEDPGHAWLKVSLEDILKVGLMPSAFSSYSYRNGDSFFLEEDCDWPRFFKQWAQCNQDEAVVQSHYSSRNSKIRSYDRIR